MNYNPYQYNNPYQYGQPMQDQLAQFRQPYQNSPFPQQGQYQNGSGVIWVQGEEGAKAYMVVPGNSVLLMDSEQSSFYMKSCDRSGIPSLRIFDYTERAAQRSTQPQMAKTGNYATQEEIEVLRVQVAALQAQISAMTSTAAPREENANG